MTEGEGERERREREWGEKMMETMNVHPIVHTPDSNAPGRVPGYKDSDVKLLPSSTTKHTIWELYLQAAATSLMRAVAYSTFTHLWRQLLPHVVVMKPMSDLCWVCQQNSTAIMRSANRPDEEKSTVSIHMHASVEQQSDGH